MTERDPARLNRRAFTQLAAASLALGAAGGARAAEDPFTALRSKPVSIGILMFPRIDQIDFTGPFEVLARVPDATIRAIAKGPGPIRDHKGMILTPEVTIAQCPPLDVVVVPGGPGQEALMEDEAVLSFIRAHAQSGKPVYSVCTGALICGAAGILQGKRATTHWAAQHLLGYFGATAVDQRVVVDGSLISAAGVTAGIDGALTLAALLRSEAVAQEIQLDIQYAPDPPFHAGDPTTAPPAVLAAVKGRYAALTATREATARRIAQGLGA